VRTAPFPAARLSSLLIAIAFLYLKF
jgi:hypothetical protein